MPEGNADIEIVQHLREHGGHGDVEGPSRRRIETIEILEAILLAIVALSTALSGYQAAKWDGESAKAYATSSRLRAQSNETRHPGSRPVPARHRTALPHQGRAPGGDRCCRRVSHLLRRPADQLPARLRRGGSGYAARPQAGGGHAASAAG